jgi:hypothetical protein
VHGFVRGSRGLCAHHRVPNFQSEGPGTVASSQLPPGLATGQPRNHVTTLDTDKEVAPWDWYCMVLEASTCMLFVLPNPVLSKGI